MMEGMKGLITKMTTGYILSSSPGKVPKMNNEIEMVILCTLNFHVNDGFRMLQKIIDTFYNRQVRGPLRTQEGPKYPNRCNFFNDLYDRFGRGSRVK